MSRTKTIRKSKKYSSLKRSKPEHKKSAKSVIKFSLISESTEEEQKQGCELVEN